VIRSSGSGLLDEWLVSLMMLHSCRFYFELMAARMKIGASFEWASQSDD